MENTRSVLLVWILIGIFIADVHNIDMEYRTFRCRNGTYISGQLICDGKKDCIENDDGLDENFAFCDFEGNCSHGMFRCANLKWSCKNYTTRCDTNEDCFWLSFGLNHWDEEDCGDEIMVRNCSFDERKYLCRDELKCIDFSYICDGYCNCFDCSDEKHGCPNNESDDNNVLFYTTNNEFRAVNLLTNITFMVKEISDGCTAFTVARNYVYFATYGVDLFVRGHETVLNHFSDNKNNKNKYIFKMSIASKQMYKIMEINEKITSLAVDSITSNIYYTTSSSLSVCSSDGKFCEELRSGNCSSIHLVPTLGLMFWLVSQESSNSAGKIYLHLLMKSSMDGSAERLLIKFEHPDCHMMTVDESTERIYWYCASHREVRSVTFNGHNQKVWSFDLKVYKGVVFENEMFFINTERKKIFSVGEYQEATQRYLTSKLWSNDDDIDDLYVCNPLPHRRSKISDPCPKSCLGLCLTRPSSSKNSLNFTCVQQNRIRIITIIGILAVLSICIILLVLSLVVCLKRI